jgi:hypothetical protein
LRNASNPFHKFFGFQGQIRGSISIYEIETCSVGFTVSTANRSAWLPGMAEKWQSALRQLLQAELYAHDAEQPNSHFAVSVSDLLATGLTANDLRWLLVKEFAEHLIEVVPLGRVFHRRFRRSKARPLCKQSCIVLTTAGASFARQVYQPQVRPRPAVLEMPINGGLDSTIPNWDRIGRNLSLGSAAIKAFKVPAPNQQLILNAFEELHWPACIDDPLAPTEGIDSKRRLRDVVARLNKGHKRRLIRFSTNGSGSAIQWSRAHGSRMTSVGSASDRR